MTEQISTNKNITAPKPYSVEWYEQLARSERAFAKDRRQTVESTRIHLRNAETYDEMAEAARQAIKDEGNVYTRRQVD